MYYPNNKRPINRISSFSVYFVGPNLVATCSSVVVGESKLVSNVARRGQDYARNEGLFLRGGFQNLMHD